MSALTQTRSDRTWPIPNNPWIMRMKWHDLLFMHYPVEPDVLRHLIPDSLEIDTYDGNAWIGIVPFRMTGVAPRFVPSIPPVSNFPELNVRTYVKVDGKPGVWFFAWKQLTGLPFELRDDFSICLTWTPPFNFEITASTQATGLNTNQNAHIVTNHPRS